MENIAAVIKNEMRVLVKKGGKANIASTKRAMARLRCDISLLK